MSIVIFFFSLPKIRATLRGNLRLAGGYLVIWVGASHNIHFHHNFCVLTRFLFYLSAYLLKGKDGSNFYTVETRVECLC